MIKNGFDIRTINDVKIEGKKIIVRVDFNVSLTEKSYYTGIILNSIKNIRESVADDANYRERSEPTRTLANR